MSEYQYYEFQAIDRPLSVADCQALRAISSRARITATSFTNSYEWGDFKGDPARLMKQWFDLHLYVANWGSHRLMIRLPKRMLDRERLDDFIGEVDCAELTDAGDNLILDVSLSEIETDESDDGSGWLAALAPLRGDVLGGDLRLFYLLWLTAVQADVFLPETPEPLPGLGPMTGALEACAEFLGIDADLVAAAAERCAEPDVQEQSGDAVREVIAGMGEAIRTDFLLRVFHGDAHVASALRAHVRQAVASDAAPSPVTVRTVGELRARAEALCVARERAEAVQAATEQRRRAEEAEQVRRAKLDAIRRRGESVWREVEGEIERRNATSYDRAASLLLDLKVIAEEGGSTPNFVARLRAIRQRHSQKGRCIERLAALG